ncbi:MAG: glycosyltransferase family 4 protein [Desulfobacterales bacterium]|nr:glycosyltransferase family 4 protein [Desulfobacterales bacterium]
MKRQYDILVVHEVDYFNKVIFEFQIIPEIFSLLGHKVSIVDYPEGETTASCKNDFKLKGQVFEHVQRVYKSASVKILRPFCSKLFFSERLSYVSSFGSFLEKIIKNNNIDFILLYSAPNSGWQTAGLACKYNIPVIFRSIDVLHQIVPHRIYKYPTLLAEKYVCKNSDLILALTPKLKDYMIRLGADEKNIVIQLSGVDTEKFRPLQKNWNLAQKWGISKGDKIAMFMGTLYDFSSLDWLAENWNRILQVVPEAKLLIVGNGHLFMKLKHTVQKKNLEKNIILTDWQNYDLLPDFINLSDIGLNLFKINDITRDIIPTKLFQYLACAKPIVAFPLPGTLPILKNEQDGIVYADNSENALNIIIDLFKNHDKAEQIGKNGYHLMNAEYEWKKIAESMLDIIDQQFNVSGKNTKA